MKTTKIMLAAMMALMTTFQSHAQTTDKSTSTDSAAIQLRLTQLIEQKSQLTKQIAEEDRKRNQTIAGVTIENMEIMNLKQDSICLELRSKMTDVDLEIAERKAALALLAANATPAATGPTTNSTTSATTPQKPTPQKPTPQKPNKLQQAIQALQNRPNKK